MACTIAGNTQDLRRLLAGKGRPDHGDYDKRRPLHLAASEGQLECVELLLASQANVNVLDRWGRTPLWDGIRPTPPPLSTNRNKQTHGTRRHPQKRPFLLAALSNCNAEVARVLRKHGGLVNRPTVRVGSYLCDLVRSAWGALPYYHRFGPIENMTIYSNPGGGPASPQNPPPHTPS